MEPHPDQKQTENLGNHYDWSIFTLESVVCPEDVAKQYAEREAFDRSLSETWHGAYMVPMAGNWLGFLTNGKVPSTIHGVVLARETPQRYSTPFFSRLRLAVLEAVERTSLDSPSDIEASTLAMGNFLLQYKDLR